MNETADSIRRRSVGLSSVQPAGRLTRPPTFGVYLLPARAGATRRYRYGNHPVRMRELHAEFGDCSLVALFLQRVDAASLAEIENHARQM